MKYLKLFENFEDIHKICEKYDIKNYTINGDGSIDVDGDVDLWNKGLDELPLKFNNISGDFICSLNNYNFITKNFKIKKPHQGRILLNKSDLRI